MPASRLSVSVARWRPTHLLLLVAGRGSSCAGPASRRHAACPRRPRTGSPGPLWHQRQRIRDINYDTVGGCRKKAATSTGNTRQPQGAHKVASAPTPVHFGGLQWSACCRGASRLDRGLSDSTLCDGRFGCDCGVGKGGPAHAASLGGEGLSVNARLAGNGPVSICDLLRPSVA